MKSFKVHENGKVYNVTVRAAYAETITSERKLRNAVSKAMIARYGAGTEANNSFFYNCDILGILAKRAPETK